MERQSAVGAQLDAAGARGADGGRRVTRLGGAVDRCRAAPGAVADVGNRHRFSSLGSRVEAYIPPYGWIGVDATLGTPCTGQHVKLGVGRDYADVAVLRGTYHGGGRAELEVEVTCESLGGLGEGAQTSSRVDEPVARLVAIQNLGAMRQYQRGAVMTQAMGGMTQEVALEELPPLREQLRPEDGPPSQQPQQQQQDGA